MNSLNQFRQLTGQSTYAENLTHLFNAAIKENIPIAIWRKPAEEQIQAICQISDRKLQIEELENAPEGFIFHPFRKPEGESRNYILSEIELSQKKNEFVIHPTLQNHSTELSAFFHVFKELQSDDKFKFTDFLHSSPEVDEDKDKFISLVEKCKQYISEGYYQKIVPSRRAKYGIKKNFHPVHELFKLCEAYENAFVSLVYMPGNGLWIGATPELLISTENNQYFHTVSLAGTQGVPPDFDLSRAAWRHKEIEEQALVSRYIVNCFKQIRLREYDENGPKTVKAGNLIHLKTSFKVDMKATNFPELASTMLQLLHPTSAICGMPMKPAAQFLEQNEGYDREYFSGYLGPVNFESSTSIFVNLRCSRVYRDGGVIYAGAGVTEYSIAEDEWAETEIKFRTLLNVFESNA
ncbi:chorismate-binding protein [Reichenbachiella agarivorans]|uniref:Chorismate-binding protein n=1 Tax=Reichenbachiella agarivorans TaxID=2979464 RepID=A0ABY6CML0_9BACT|nr:chorismate-binding protein [Reichenbachiella agarivorans]UXP31609.1 chorismate-binding protein [Reichenbachiella agarivorans]